MIDTKHTIKYVGEHLDRELTFKKHIDDRLTNAKAAIRTLYPLLKRNNIVSRDNKLLLYRQVIRPIRKSKKKTGKGFWKRLIPTTTQCGELSITLKNRIRNSPHWWEDKKHMRQITKKALFSVNTFTTYPYTHKLIISISKELITSWLNFKIVHPNMNQLTTSLPPKKSGK